MALSFQSKRNSLLNCTVHRDSNGHLFIDMNGYIISLPSARDYCDVVEHLIIIEDCFEDGFTLQNCID